MKLDSAVNRQITELYDTFTNVEKRIADYFLHNEEKENFAAKTIANKLFVSEASLSRFAKKCGYKGFREFVYEYERALYGNANKISYYTGQVIGTYQDLLQKSIALVDEGQVMRIEKMLAECKRVRVYGKGSSGFAAQEFSVRFMRMGMDIEAITDSHVIKMSAALADPDTVVMAISLSGTTKEILTAVKYAKKNGSKVIMITANQSEELAQMCDEVLLVASIRNLDEGTMISPQFPVQVMIDILFTYFFQTDFHAKLQVFRETLAALYDEEN